MHGCVGIHAWLRLKPWYARVAPILGCLAVALAVFSLTGFVSAGAHGGGGERGAALRAAAGAAMDLAGEQRLQLVSILAGVALLLSPFARPFLKRLRAEFTVTYDGEPTGPWRLRPDAPGDQPGGRHRPCLRLRRPGALFDLLRVQVLSGLQKLPPPGIAEARLLDRISAPSDVRLACQTRPMGDVTVRLLVGGSSVYDPATASDPIGGAWSARSP